jgi:2-dehydro-3-deoxygluconokinase
MQVLAVGETMTLVAPTSPLPLADADTFRLDIGGAESNVASHLARAGVAAAWASAVGDDPFGRRLIATLTERGVDTSLVRVDAAAPTGVYFKDPGPEGTRVLYYRRGSAASRLGPEFAATLPLETVPLLHISGITPALSSSCAALIDELITVRRRAGLPVSFDVNYRAGLWPVAEAAPALLDLARRCDLVFVGRDEAELLWGTRSADTVRELLGDTGRLVVKDGAEGAHAFDGENSWFVPSLAIDVVEPVGAGDAFAAGFLAADLQGAPPPVALEQGHAFAALVLGTMSDY